MDQFFIIIETKIFFLVVVILLCKGAAYAYSPSVNIPILKIEGIEQDIPPPHIPPPSLPAQVFLRVGEIADIPYPVFGLMVWECDNPPEDIEQEESCTLEPMVILCIKGVMTGGYQVNMKWYDSLNPGQPLLERQTVQIIIQPWP